MHWTPQDPLIYLMLASAHRGKMVKLQLVSIYSFQFPFPLRAGDEGLHIQWKNDGYRHVLAKMKRIPQFSVDRLIRPVLADATRVDAEVRSLPKGSYRSHGSAGPRLPCLT